MFGEHEPSTNPGQDSEQNPDSRYGNSAADRIYQILEDRDIPNRDAIMEDPRMRTMLETGQITVAGAMERETAVGSTELPRVKPPKHSRKSRGKSYPDEITGQDVSRQMANEAAESEGPSQLSEAGKKAREEAKAIARRGHWESVSNNPDFLKLPNNERMARAKSFGERRYRP
jgi:hypothetical protein